MVVVGTLEGAWDGEHVGAAEVTALGTKLGPYDGTAVSPTVGLPLGVTVGILEGAWEGEQVGAAEGTALGTKLGP